MSIAEGSGGGAGALLRGWRDSGGWSQGQLAEALGVTQSTVSRIESGAAVPSLALAAQVEALTRGYVMASAWVREAAAAGVGHGFIEP